MTVALGVGGLGFSTIVGMAKTYNCPLCTLWQLLENDFDKHIANHCPFCEFSSEIHDALVIHIYYHKHPSRAPSAFSESHFDEQPITKKQAPLLSPTDQLMIIHQMDCPVSPILPQRSRRSRFIAGDRGSARNGLFTTKDWRKLLPINPYFRWSGSYGRGVWMRDMQRVCIRLWKHARAYGKASTKKVKPCTILWWVCDKGVFI